MFYVVEQSPAVQVPPSLALSRTSTWYISRHEGGELSDEDHLRGDPNQQSLPGVESLQHDRSRFVSVLSKH